MLRISTDKSKKSLLDDVYKYDCGDKRYQWHDKASSYTSKRWVRRDFYKGLKLRSPDLIQVSTTLLFSRNRYPDRSGSKWFVAEVSDLQRGLEPTETETNIHKWGFRFSSPSPLGQPLLYDVRCVWTTLSRSRSYCTVWLFISALPFTFLKNS